MESFIDDDIQRRRERQQQSLLQPQSSRILQQRKLPIVRRLFNDSSSLRQSSHYDRFIPVRSSNSWQTNFDSISFGAIESPKNAAGQRKSKDSTNAIESREYSAYGSLLRNELLGESIEDLKVLSACDERQNGLNSSVLGPTSAATVTTTPTAVGGAAAVATAATNAASGASHSTSSSAATSSYSSFASVNSASKRLFSYATPSSTPTKNKDDYMSSFSSSPISISSQKLLRSPHKTVRKMSKIPFKILDAPELQDDFYLNLVDWSQQNVLSVGLGSCVYLWSACTSQVTKLCDLSIVDRNSVTAVAWNERGNLLAVGTHHGYVCVWDIDSNKVIRKFSGHTARVGALAWNGDILASGSRDRQILLRDVQSYDSNRPFIRNLEGHRQEVCGLKWSPDNQFLASGGNDNKLLVWCTQSSYPVQAFNEHSAAVKAIAWSPHHHGLLASGGGTADRCIRFWNTLTSQPMQCVDTGSQVCNLAWSKHSSELVSTHGYSQNQILVWKYPSLTQVAKLTGHSYRVLYLALSPDGETIVTGAGDETLRFWNVFTKGRSHKEIRSVLSLYTGIR